MEEAKDIRWTQRFDNYKKALRLLTEGAEIITQELGKAKFEETAYERISDLLKEGLIKRFEYTHQLAWNVMKDYEEYQGISPIMSSRDATHQALKIGLIDDTRWMNMIDNRNLTADTYNENTATQVVKEILQVYHPLFLKYEETINRLLIN